MWHEGQRDHQDARYLGALLDDVSTRAFSKEAEGGGPSNADGHKERCLSADIEYTAKEEATELDGGTSVLPEDRALYDAIEVSQLMHDKGHFRPDQGNAQD